MEEYCLPIGVDPREHMRSLGALYRVWDTGQSVYNARDSTPSATRIALAHADSVLSFVEGGEFVGAAIKRERELLDRKNAALALKEISEGKDSVPCYFNISGTFPELVRWVGVSREKKIVQGIAPSTNLAVEAREDST